MLTQLHTRAQLTVKLFWRLLLASIHILAVTVIAWYGLRIYPGDLWMPVRLANYFAPWLFIALIPAFFVVFVGRRRRLVGTMMALITLMTIHYWPLLIPPQAQVYADSYADEFRVMTFNVNFNNRNATGIAELVQAEAPDLIAFQEMTAELFDLLHPKLKTAYPYYLIDNSWDLPMVLVSRYPLMTQPKPAGAIRAQHATVETPDGTVVIWNVHPNPVIASGWESQKKLLSFVAEDVAAEDKPVIVLGDFNTTDQTENYRLIANQLTDVHWTAGQGFGFTFPDFSRAITADQPWPMRRLLEAGPVIRIDHIFVSEHFTPQETYVLPASYQSDHRPVVAELSWPTSE